MTTTPSDSVVRAPARDRIALGVSIGLVLLVALIGRTVTDTDAGSWYSSLEQPTWNPPDWLFGPVWSALYVAMAVAAWIVWRQRGFAAVGPYFVQLTLNLAWTIVFFGFEAPWPAFGVIVLLALAIVVTMVTFDRVSRVATCLLVPYLGWVGYAGALNLAIAILN